MTNLEEGFIGEKYFVDKEANKTGKNTWDILEVKIFRLIEGKKEKIGRYSRNYPSLYNTFLPFIQNGKEYALYSNHYMHTRIMELPSCKDIGGEDQSNVKYEDHFCPVEYYVPIYRKITFAEEFKGKKLEGWLTGDECLNKKHENSQDQNVLGPIQYCNFGFVAGCVWGDDSSWKIQFLDLTEIDKGIIKRDDRLGYIELPRKMNLKDAINIDEPGDPWIEIIHTTHINYETKEQV